MSFSVSLEPPECEQCGRGGEPWNLEGMTYNLAPMFHKAGFYEAMKNETGGTGSGREVLFGYGRKQLDRPKMKGRELAPLVRRGLDDMIANADEYRKLAPENGWGDYDGALRFTRELLGACEQNPDATVQFRG